MRFPQTLQHQQRTCLHPDHLELNPWHLWNLCSCQPENHSKDWDFLESWQLSGWRVPWKAITSDLPRAQTSFAFKGQHWTSAIPTLKLAPIHLVFLVEQANLWPKPHRSRPSRLERSAPPKWMWDGIRQHCQFSKSLYTQENLGNVLVVVSAARQPCLANLSMPLRRVHAFILSLSGMRELFSKKNSSKAEMYCIIKPTCRLFLFDKHWLPCRLEAVTARLALRLSQ